MGGFVRHIVNGSGVLNSLYRLNDPPCDLFQALLMWFQLGASARVLQYKYAQQEGAQEWEINQQNGSEGGLNVPVRVSTVDYRGLDKCCRSQCMSQQMSVSGYKSPLYQSTIGQRSGLSRRHNRNVSMTVIPWTERINVLYI